MKRISTEAYQALRAALPVITWNKRPFETYLRTALREHPALLVGLNFSDTKRNVSDQLIDTLITHEDKYQEVTLQLMLELASMTKFPNIEQIKDEADRKLRLQEAFDAVAGLKSVTEQYSGRLAEKERQEAARKAEADQAAAIRKFSDEIAKLKDRFLALQQEADKHKRGYALESLLADLFLLYDLEPRLAYSLDLEQIDGSFSFDTDDYIIEARWREALADRGDGDIFKAKVLSKGKNAMGLFVSIKGYTVNFIKRFEESTPFITMDGSDLYMVLDGRIRLDDLLRAKKRHANDTGSCHLPATTYLTA
ncbi:hypothetical protein [Amycolatopsis sp.]|uniref:hypothetical protein n=1 Tax=Amycolatopsis sp. TaxID=37632 RepID=UPI002B78BE2A|nr:hypothetical protein [Amycolatopsis sp.]HVV12472.1 hypothetical protein [Amycolatopsis sp.]